MPLLIDQHTGSATYIETIHDDSFYFDTADAVDFFGNNIVLKKNRSKAGHKPKVMEISSWCMP